MDFAFSEEQELLRASARDFLADRWPIERALEVADADPAYDATAWKELAELGWLDLGADGLGMLEHAVLAETTAAALLPLPWFSTVALAAPLLDDELAGAVAVGERAVTAAAAPTLTGGGGTLTGVVALVPDVAAVTDAIVVAGDGIYAIDLAANADVVVARSTMDRTRRLGELRLDSTPARRLEVGADRVDLARRRALALAACEAVGVAQRAFDLAADYTKTRQQFGRVIGTYQGVSHKVANMYAAVELSRSLAYWAAWSVSESDPQQEVAVAAAKAAATEGAVQTVESAIQVHGGIGFTWEHVLQRYYKRAQWLEAFAGYGRVHRAAVAAALLDKEAVA